MHIHLHTPCPTPEGFRPTPRSQGTLSDILEIFEILGILVPLSTPGDIENAARHMLCGLRPF